MLSWVFGNSKKKEPMVTIDPRPIDDFHVITTPQNPAPSYSSNLYPDLSSASALPYPSSPRPNLGHVTHLQRANSGPEVLSQLESVPFQLDAQLQENGSRHANSANDWRELSRTFRRTKQHLDNGEFDYDFSLERRVLNEERMANGLDSLIH
ncbi:hypothetical protein LSTR_LSTR014434 [Laodelphax striatellus]|uniref:UMA domain-containing protein n=1 Tax=Laodelphax striatellus TaxID=195883 RepID=A0A482X787_LAOST|nr:hypothetical protein LSTR_LSTR010498 [Laodelphax striatellus]RZF42813.1 hypothetical protein LSTR_LSTR014434 [Laodelphax striatellus]